MKKAILIIASFLAIASTVDAQKKEELKGIKTSRNKLEFDSAKVVVEANKDTLFVIRAKVVVIDSVNFSIEVLKEYAVAVKANKVPVYASFDWIANTYKFIKTAPNPGFADTQMDLLKEPLIPWLQYLERLQQAQKK